MSGLFLILNPTIRVLEAMPGHLDQRGFSLDPEMMDPHFTTFQTRDFVMDPSTMIDYPGDGSWILLHYEQPLDNTCYLPEADQSSGLSEYYGQPSSYPIPIGYPPLDYTAYEGGRSGSFSSASSVDSNSGYASSDYSHQVYSESIYHPLHTEVQSLYHQLHPEEQNTTSSPIFNVPLADSSLGLGTNDWIIDQLPPYPDPSFQFPPPQLSYNSSNPTLPMPIPIAIPQNLFDQPLHIRAPPLDRHNQHHLYDAPTLKLTLPVDEPCRPSFPAASESSFLESHTYSSPSTSPSSKGDADDDLMRALMGLSRHPWPSKYESEVFTAEDMRLPAVKRRRIYINSLEQACNQLHAILRAHGLQSPMRPDGHLAHAPGEIKPRDNKLSIIKAQYETTIICERIVYLTELENARKSPNGPKLHHPHSDPTFTLV